MSPLRGVVLPVALAFVAASFPACASSPSTPPASGDDGNGSPSPHPAATETASAHADEGPSWLNTSDHEMTHRDCQALGERYRDLVVSDEMVKLDPKLTSDQREKGHDAIMHGAEQLAGPWIDRCGESLVGKFASEEALRCAVSAKTVMAFDVCLNGPPGPPAGSSGGKASPPPKK